MEKIELHPDFKDFLRFLNSNGVEYLIVGGYAVGYHGYPRATGDMDIWIGISEWNAEKAAKALRDFGMPEEQVSKQMFLEKDKVIRIGVPPVRLEIITGASGVDFPCCYSRKKSMDIDGIPVNFISLEDLRANKRAAGSSSTLSFFIYPPLPAHHKAC
ncbi:hypothetical protein HZA56_01465 [Candidatus Poribacteria bacterium]|nr:hypothetical protein [Candidatus Poribacteria bacterium]